MCGAGDLLMGFTFPVEGTDDADTPQAFPDEIILFITVFVGNFPEMLDFFTHQHARTDQEGHCTEDDQGKKYVLPHTENHAAQKHQRNNQDAAAETIPDGTDGQESTTDTKPDDQTVPAEPDAETPENTSLI